MEPMLSCDPSAAFNRRNVVQPGFSRRWPLRVRSLSRGESKAMVPPAALVTLAVRTTGPTLLRRVALLEMRSPLPNVWAGPGNPLYPANWNTAAVLPLPTTNAEGYVSAEVFHTCNVPPLKLKVPCKSNCVVRKRPDVMVINPVPLVVVEVTIN